MTQKSSSSITIPELYWAAGFIEGEGCFTPAHNRAKYWGDRIRVTQNQREPLERLQTMFGGTITPIKAKRDRQGKLVSRSRHLWQVTGGRARGVMMTLYTLMSPWRQEQIRDALDRTRHRKGYPYRQLA